MKNSQYNYKENDNRQGNSKKNMKASNSTFNPDLFDPKKLISLIQRHIWAVLLCILFSIAVTYYIVNYHLLPVYQSSGTIIVTTDESSLPGSGGGENASAVADIIARSFSSNYGNPVQNAIYLFQAWELSHAVANHLIEDIDQSTLNDYPSFWSKYPEDSTIISVDQAASRIRNGLTVEPVEPKSKLLEVRNPNLLSVSFQSYSPKEAAEVVNLALEVFQEKSLQQKQNAASKALSFLQGKKEQAREQLDIAEDRLVSFKNENQLVAIDAQANNSVNSLSELQAEKQNIEINLESVNSSIQNYEQQMEAIKPGLKDQYTNALGPTITKYQERLAELRIRKFVILSKNPQLRDNPNSEPELINLNKQIEGLENEIQKMSEVLMKDNEGIANTGDGNLAEELSNIRQNIIQLRLQKNQYESQIEVLNQRIKEAESFLDTYPDKQVKLARLETDVQRHRQLLNNIITQESEIALWQQTQNSSGTIVDQANPRYNPVKPNKILWLGFSGMVGLVLPIGLILLKSLYSSIINSSEQLKSYPYPLLSVVYDHSLIKSNGWFSDKTKTKEDSKISKSIVFHHFIDTPVAESYRKIVSHVLYSDPDSIPHSLLITSSGQGEGKTTLTANLGAAFAEVDRKVLIIDCDFRRPAIHKLFSLQNNLGIKEVLFDGCKLSEAIKETGIDGLNVLTTGGRPNSPTKLLGSDKFKEMIKVIRPNYDIILFDTPPQGLVSEVASLLNLTDLVIVAAKFGQTSRNVLNHTLEELEKNEETSINLVLTCYKPAKSYDSYDTKGLHKYMYQQYYEYEQIAESK